MAKTNWATMNTEAKQSFSEYGRKYSALAAAKDAYKAATDKLSERIAKGNTILKEQMLGVKKYEDSIIDMWRQNVTDDEKTLADNKKKYDEACDAIGTLESTAKSLVTRDLYNAYCERMEYMTKYNAAWRDWCNNLGVKLEDSTLACIKTSVGYGNVRVSTKLVSTNGLKNVSYANFCKIVMSTIANLSGLDK